MFNAIAGRYDFLNHLLSMGQDVRWRKALKKFLPDSDKQTILDLATGTADVLIVLAKDNPKIHRGVGVDPAIKMLEIGRKKIIARHLDDRLNLQQGDAQALPLPIGPPRPIRFAALARLAPQALLPLGEWQDRRAERARPS